MNHIEAVATGLKSLVQLIVRIPNHVRVTTTTSNDPAGREMTSFEIDVHESDRGRLIGRCGANMRALRVLLNSAAYVCGTRYRVSCNDGPENVRASCNPAGKGYEFVHHDDA
jgi:predicted RNA-binding protein YlqC (UPF0109 family)